MPETTAEVLILTVTAFGAGILMFISEVIQKMMNSMNEADFKKFLNTMDKTAMNDPFSVTVATVPFIAAIAYIIFYGINHIWFIAGIIVWIIGSSITKIINLPVYRWIGNPKNTDVKKIREQRRKLQLGNNLRAWSTLVSVILMTMQFGIRVTLLSVIVFILLAVPLTRFSSRYKF